MRARRYSVPPLLFSSDEAVGLKEAAFIARRSVDTVRRWYDEHGIGRQAGPGAPIEISVVALQMVLHGDFGALDLLKAGDRSNPRVRQYIEFVGLAA